MTDKEKLQKLFEAALKEPVHAPGHAPKRAFPEIPSAQTPMVHTAPILKPAPMVSKEAVLPDPELVVKPASAAPVLDDKASDELGKLLDNQLSRQSRKRKREVLVTAFVLFGLTGGGFGWFVSSPARVEAFTSAIREIRSVTDVKTIVAKYQATLNKVNARGQQIDQASAAMGVSKSAEDEKDPYMEAEMKQMSGGEGKTVDERNRALQASFGNRAEADGGRLKPTAAISKENSFDVAY